MRHLDVACAVITRKGKDGRPEIFCAQRPGPKPGQERKETDEAWEFPGGKIEKGETPEEAVVREIREEMDATIRVDFPAATVEHSYADFSLTLHAFSRTVASGSLTLKEHLSSRWVPLRSLPAVPWAGADRKIAQSVLAALEGGKFPSSV